MFTQIVSSLLNFNPQAITITPSFIERNPKIFALPYAKHSFAVSVKLRANLYQSMDEAKNYLSEFMAFVLKEYASFDGLQFFETHLLLTETPLIDQLTIEKKHGNFVIYSQGERLISFNRSATPHKKAASYHFPRTGYDKELYLTLIFVDMPNIYDHDFEAAELRGNIYFDYQEYQVNTFTV